MRIKFDKGSLGTGTSGVEVGIDGFKSNPADLDNEPCQVFIEVYEGVLQVHVWDGSSEDPKTIKIEPR